MSPRSFAGSPSYVVVAILAFLCLAGASPALAQRAPTPPDTVPAAPDLESTPVPDRAPVADTVATGAAAPAGGDTAVAEAPPGIVRMPERAPGEWAAGEWVWEHEDLLLSGALNLTELLEQLPSVVPVRSTTQGLPQTASAFGLGAGRIEVVLDGYVLDPLGDGTLDLSRIELIELARVRVERRTDLLRIELTTLAPFDARPYSRVEAGTGDFGTNMVRGLFLAPRVLRGSLGLGVERLESDATVPAQPSQTFAGWLKWTAGSSRRGIQFEARRATMERGGGTPAPGEGTRTDLVLRGRLRPVDALGLEAYVGRSILDDAFAPLPDSPVPPAAGGESEGPSKRYLTTVQAGARARLAAGPLWTGVDLRYRNGRGLPEVEAVLSAGADLGGWARVDGDVTWAERKGLPSARAWAVRGRTRRLLGLAAFAELSGGSRVIPAYLLDAASPLEEELPEEPVTSLSNRIDERTAVRVGGDVAIGGFHAGAAGLVLDADSTPVFGLDFDRTATQYPAGRARGWEVTGRLPLIRNALFVEGSFTRWQETGGWIYLPVEVGRGALLYHGRPLGHDQLEVLARVQGVHRGAMRVPTLDGGLAIAPAGRQLDFYLQIRIIDVRAFLRWENILNNTALADLPDRPYPGQRVFYGVKWHFWN